MLKIIKPNCMLQRYQITHWDIKCNCTLKNINRIPEKYDVYLVMHVTEILEQLLRRQLLHRTFQFCLKYYIILYLYLSIKIKLKNTKNNILEQKILLKINFQYILF